MVKVVKPNDHSTGSKLELLSDLEQRIKHPKHVALGYVFDADDPNLVDQQHPLRDLRSTWQAIRSRLERLPMNSPLDENPRHEGYVGTHAKLGIPIGVWLMPDNSRDGALEDFLRDLIGESDRLAPFADSSTRTAKEEHGVSSNLRKLARDTVGLTPEEIAPNFRSKFDSSAQQQDRATSEVESLVSDMGNFIARLPSEKYSLVHKDMEEKKVIAALTELSGLVRANLVLKSVGTAKLWGTQLDKWAEMLQDVREGTL